MNSTQSFYSPEFVSSLLLENFGYSQKYQFKFIDYIKGLYVILLIVDDIFYIYTDHLGINKFFYTLKGQNEIIIASCIKYITTNITFDIDSTNLLINILLNHYIDGKTFIKNVFYSKPATKLTLSSKNIAISNYWDIDELLTNNDNLHSIDFMPEFFNSLTKSYVEFFSPEQISLSITGGLDCRQIMASLLANNIQFKTYTYGHPHSIDVYFGKKVAEEMGLEHSVYYPKGVSRNWYELLANEIVEKGNSITSIHRAHRLYAIKNEASKCNLMFIGYMGGEIVRGNWPDDLITSAFMRQYWKGNIEFDDLVIKFANQNYFKIKNINLQALQSYFASLRFVGNSSKINNLYFLFVVQAFIHYAQDINLFRNYIKYVVPTFIDIDYLEKIFSSKYSMLFRANMTKSNIRRFNSTYFSCYMIDKIWPPLSNIILSKGYSPKELITNKALMLIKRQYRLIHQKNYARNLAYGKWYYEFFIDNIQKNNEISEYFHVNHALDTIANYSDLISDEQSCLPFTRMVELSKMIKSYRISINNYK